MASLLELSIIYQLADYSFALKVSACKRGKNVDLPGFRRWWVASWLSHSPRYEASGLHCPARGLSAWVTMRIHFLGQPPQEHHRLGAYTEIVFSERPGSRCWQAGCLLGPPPWPWTISPRAFRGLVCVSVRVHFLNQSDWGEAHP